MDNSPAKDFFFTTCENPNEKVQLSVVGKGKKIVLDFYTTWWGGCHNAATKIQKYADKNPNLLWLCVNLDKDTHEDIQAFGKKNSVKDSINVKPEGKDKVKGDFKVSYFPYHVIIDENFNIAMSGGYDMEKKGWKNWEEIAGVKKITNEELES